MHADIICTSSYIIHTCSRSISSTNLGLSVSALIKVCSTYTIAGTSYITSIRHLYTCISDKRVLYGVEAHIMHVKYKTPVRHH